MKRHLAIFCLVLGLLALGGIAVVAADDDHDHGHGENHRRSRHEGGHAPALVTNAAYAAACGQCHMAYPPGLLPAASWKQIIAVLPEHFGQQASLADNDKQAVADFLAGNAADRAGSKVSRKIMDSLGGAIPWHIADIPYIRRKHHELDNAVFQRKSVQSLANCIACHPGAASGDFHDDNVRIPAQ